MKRENASKPSYLVRKEAEVFYSDVLFTIEDHPELILDTTLHDSIKDQSAKSNDLLILRSL